MRSLYLRTWVPATATSLTYVWFVELRFATDQNVAPARFSGISSECSREILGSDGNAIAPKLCAYASPRPNFVRSDTLISLPLAVPDSTVKISGVNHPDAGPLAAYPTAGISPIVESPALDANPPPALGE